MDDRHRAAPPARRSPARTTPTPSTVTPTAAGTFTISLTDDRQQRRRLDRRRPSSRSPRRPPPPPPPSAGGGGGGGGALGVGWLMLLLGAVLALAAVARCERRRAARAISAAGSSRAQGLKPRPRAVEPQAGQARGRRRRRRCRRGRRGSRRSPCRPSIRCAGRSSCPAAAPPSAPLRPRPLPRAATGAVSRQLPLVPGGAEAIGIRTMLDGRTWLASRSGSRSPSDCRPNEAVEPAAGEAEEEQVGDAAPPAAGPSAWCARAALRSPAAGPGRDAR